MPSTYRPVNPDGAKWRCTDCETNQPASNVWFVELTNGWKGIICKQCIDQKWIEQYATFIPEPV